MALVHRRWKSRCFEETRHFFRRKKAGAFCEEWPSVTEGDKWPPVAEGDEKRGYSMGIFFPVSEEAFFSLTSSTPFLKVAAAPSSATSAGSFTTRSMDP